MSKYPCVPCDPSIPTNENSLRGLTKREYFSAKFLAAIIPKTHTSDQQISNYAAKHAVYLADALINALNAEQ